MTRDSAAVAPPDDRRRCPISAASNAVDNAPSLMANTVTTSGSSSNGDVSGAGTGGNGGSEEGASPKSSSAVSTTTSCCGGSSSSSSRSGSDDDDSTAVSGLPTVIEDCCTTNVNTLSLPPLLKDVANNSSANHNSSSNSNDAVTTTTSSTNIGGRLTFYKDGKFIFQLEAHQQQNQYNNSSALTSPCRWIPVPTVIQQQKNNIKKISEWSSHHQKNKTIWPYLVADQPAAIGSKSPQQIHKSLSLPTVKPGERHLFQHCQQRTTPPPLTPIAAVNPQGCTTSVVVATTKNIVRRPSRKYSTTALIENVTDPQHLNRQPQSLQLRNLLRRSQQHQHQSFIMVATKAIKAQRRLTPLLKKQRRRHCQRLVAKTAVGNEPPLFDTLQPRAVNLEPVVRYLWCRRHTSELLRKQLSLNNNLDVSVDNTLPVFSQNNTADSLCSNISGSSKCKPVFSPSSLATSVAVFPTTKISTDSLSGIGSNSSSSPLKKYKIGHNQQKRQLFVDSSPKIAIPSLSAHTPTNNHSITAILSGNIMGAKRGSTTTSIKETDPCVISSTVTSTSTASPVTTPQKNVSPAPLSLLRTLLKSPSCETNSQPVKQASSNSSGYMKQNTGSSRKRSAIDSQIISPAIISTPEVSNSGPITATMAISPTIKNSAVDDSTAALSVLRQLPTLQHPGAAGQLAAAGYFNVLYHQAAMAAAMAYQSHVQLPQSLSKPTPLSQAPTMLSSQFSTTGGSHNGWPCQLNRQPPLSVPETIMGENGVATPSLSTSTIVAPYSSPLPTATVNGNGQLPPATPSPPPLLMHPVHPRHLLLHHMQQHNQHQHYQPAPTVQQSLSYYQHKKRHLNSNVNKRTAPMGDTAEYGSNIEKNNVVVYKESSSTDCMPLNLSKDSVAENVDGANTAATVR